MTHINFDLDIARQCGNNAAIVYGWIASNGIETLKELSILTRGQIKTALRELWKAGFITAKEAGIGRAAAKQRESGNLTTNQWEEDQVISRDRAGQKYSKKLRTILSEFITEFPELKKKYGTQMLEEFMFYWSEWNLKEKKPRWAIEDTFDVARRLVTWHKNNQNKWGKENQIPQPPRPPKIKVQ